MTRFYVEPEFIEENHIAITDAEDIHHFHKVLRGKKGDEVVISDGISYEYDCVVTDISKERIDLDISSKREFASEPALDVTLYQGVPKGSKMDDVIRKCIEVGVKKVVPVKTDRVDVSEKGSNMKNRLIRWRKIAKEASKQCQRGVIPEIRDYVTNEEMYQELSDYDLVVWPYELEKSTTIKERLRGKRPKTVALIIGPEGGFSDAEAEALSRYQAVTLGKTTLRTETAGVAALSMIMYELEL